MSGEATERRYQVSVLDMQTADYHLIDTDGYFLGHIEDNQVTVRTAEVHSVEAMTMLIAMKELLHEGLRKQLLADAPDDFDPAALEQMFEEVFAEAIEAALRQPVELRDGEKK